jgi:uncharacterized protein
LDSSLTQQAALHAQPITLQDRIASIDVLRGVAILGILLMNIVTFSMVLASYENPMVYDDLSGPNWWTWLTLHLFVDQKFMTMFSVLFGAGMCIFMDRAQAKSNNAWGLQVSRLMWLFIIGMFHAYLIWYGDILVTYAIAGFAVTFVRKWKPWILFSLGIIVAICIPIIIVQLFNLTLPYWPEEEIARMHAETDLTSATNVAEIAAYTGTWVGQLPHRVVTSIGLQLFAIPFFSFWHTVGLMMIGIAAYRWRILSATRSMRFYVSMVAVGLMVGLPLISIGVWYKHQHGWDMELLRFTDSKWNAVGGGFVAMAWIGMVMLICKHSLLPSVRKALAAVGRMAFTNYIGQSVICSLIFYGHGLGWFNNVERVELLLIVAAIWTFQIVTSMLWLRWFRFGPLEWLWRSATYVQFQPMKK